MLRTLPQTLIEASKNVLEKSLYESIMLMEDRIQFLKDRNPSISTEHDPMAQHKDSGAIIDHISNQADPTKNKLYTQWLVGQYKKGAFKQEDAYKLADTIGNFDKYKHKLAQRDINQYKSIDDVKAAVTPHEGTGATKAEARKIARQDLNIPGHDLKYDDENISIYHLHDKAASKKIYARKNDKNPGIIPTEWCTATESDTNNMFDHYLKKEYPGSKLHVVHRKSDGAVFQYHPDSNQFMNANDETISAEDFKSIAPSLHKAWRENPDLV